MKQFPIVRDYLALCAKYQRAKDSGNVRKCLEYRARIERQALVMTAEAWRQVDRARRRQA